MASGHRAAYVGHFFHGGCDLSKTKVRWSPLSFKLSLSWCVDLKCPKESQRETEREVCLNRLMNQVARFFFRNLTHPQPPHPQLLQLEALRVAWLLGVAWRGGKLPTWSGRSALTASLVDAKTPDLGVRHPPEAQLGNRGRMDLEEKNHNFLAKVAGGVGRVRHVPSWR